MTVAVSLHIRLHAKRCNTTSKTLLYCKSMLTVFSRSLECNATENK